MHITLIDDSIPFDGSTPKKKSLGGAEKAFVSLCEAFALRGHVVQAVTRCKSPCKLNGVNWLPFEASRSPESEVLIAFRRPLLLQEYRSVQRRLLWLWGPATFLSKAVNQSLLQRYKPTLIYLGDVHRRSWKPTQIYSEAIIVPGVLNSYLDFESNGSEPSPVAITTTHPRHALMNILELWVNEIYPRNEFAQLHIYSVSLFRLEDSGKNMNQLGGLLSKIIKFKNCGIIIKPPMSDSIMANVYGNAKLHLYPAIETEMYGNTLAESQATGCPALVRMDNGNIGAVAERVCNGQSGYIAPDDEAFVNLATEILAKDSGLYWSLHNDALALQRQRSWQVVATEFEALWS